MPIGGYRVLIPIKLPNLKIINSNLKKGQLPISFDSPITNNYLTTFVIFQLNRQSAAKILDYNSGRAVRNNEMFFIYFHRLSKESRVTFWKFWAAYLLTLNFKTSMPICNTLLNALKPATRLITGIMLMDDARKQRMSIAHNIS